MFHLFNAVAGFSDHFTVQYILQKAIMPKNMPKPAMFPPLDAVHPHLSL